MDGSRKQKFRIRRVGSRENPYVDWALRCQYAVETVRSITSPVEVQVIELEMMQDDG